jgi:hypothetical protein
LPERTFGGRQNKKLRYAVLAAAALHGGTDPVGRPIITAGTGRGSVAMARSPSVISGCDVDLDVSGSKPENLLMEAH